MNGVLRARTGHEAKVGTVELFFDLVFVFAVTQLSHALLAHPSPWSMVQTLLLFMGVWWLWIFTIWTTNWLDPDRWPVRLMLFTLMACGLIVSMAIPHAWDRSGLAFAGAYAAIQLGRTGFMMLAVRRHSAGNYRNFARILIWLSVSAALWIAGGLSGGGTRLMLWAIAIGIEYVGPSAYFYVPGLGRSATSDWDIEGGHMAERCGLFIIIALGESILITGATAADLSWTPPVITAFASAFLGTIAMWWIYFNIGAERASHLIAHHDDPGRIARLAYTYGHIPIVAGIIMGAAADELVLAHPTGHLATATFILGGPALYLAGNIFFKRVTWKNMPLSHLVGLALLAAAALLPFHSALAVSLTSTAILLLVAVWETISLSRRSPPAPR